MIDYIYVPVPRDRVADVLRFLGTEAKVPESGALKRGPGRPPGKASTYKYPCSPKTLEHAKATVKRLTQPFAIIDLRRAMHAGTTATLGAIDRMVDQGWLKDEGYGRRETSNARVHLYRYLPAPEAPRPKRKDAPIVTGRGKVTTTTKESTITRGAPVPGTGKRDDLRGEIGRLVNALRKQGWTVERSGGDHYKATCRGMDNGVSVTLPSTPSDPRAIKNTRAQLRRYGANV